MDTGIGMKLPYIESSTVGEVAGKFSKASTAKDDAYQLAKGSGGSGVSKEGSVAKGTGDIDNPIRTYRGVELQNMIQFILRINVQSLRCLLLGKAKSTLMQKDGDVI